MAVVVNNLTPDSQALALLCTTLALPRGGLKPLNPSEWSTLAAAIRSSELRRPGELFGHAARELEEALFLPPGSGRRVEALLQRGGQLAFELERLSSRGLWLMTRADSDYPAHYKSRLKQGAPPVLFGAGPREHLNHPSAAVVGSRDADSDSLEFATALARRLVAQEFAVASGAARGIDTTAMLAALDAGGYAIGVLADALEKAIRRQDLRTHIAEGQLTLISPYHPQARFTVGNAMGRNRLIYTLTEAAFVVASGPSGGTFTGATEALKARWLPLFVAADSVATGNKALINAGAIPMHRQEIDEFDLLDRATDAAPSEQLAVNWESGVSVAEISAAAKRTSDGELAPIGANDPDARPITQIAAGDLFDVVWPSLASYLSVPRSERDVAGVFVIELAQARAWLKRAAEWGFVETMKRPVRYQLIDTRRLSLLDSDE
jgi:predicted Rossmann fold nucleotide-binding protein DprA/Smf involved in DNA uptake